MEDWNDIVFLDSEIVDDDDDAPVGTLVEREHTAPENAEQPLDSDSQNDEPQSPVVQDEQEEPIVDSEQDAEPVAESADDNSQVADDQAEQAVEEPVDEHIDEASSGDEQAVASDDNQDEQVDEEPVAEQVQEPIEDSPQAIEEVTVEDKADSDVEEAPIAKEEPKAEEPKQSTAKVSDSKTTSNIAINLKDSSSINDALFDTSFEIDRPQKAKVVSTKKKQEKEQDLWSVAPIAQKKPAKRAPAEANDAQDQRKSTKRPTPQKAVESAPVDNQEKSVAKKKVQKQESAQTVATTKVDNKKTKAEENKKMAKEAVTPSAKEIDWIQEPTEKYAGTYVIKKTDKGNFVFKLFAYNKNCLAIGAQPYTSIAGCKGGINSIIKNAATAPIANLTLKNPENTDKLPRWEIYEDKKGEYRLRLLASNGNLVATTNDGYMQASGAKKGIESIAKASVGCGIRRDDNLW